ncbi:MAG: protein translocase subunit SecD [Parvibaculum sp.]
MLRFSPWKITLIALVGLAGFIYTAPNFFSAETLKDLPGWVPQRQIVLGLDLQGGSYLLLEVETAAVQRERLETIVDDVRQSLREKRIGYTGLGMSQGAVSVRIRDAADVASAQETLDGLVNTVSANLFSGLPEADLLVVADGTHFTLTPTEASQRERARLAVEQSIEIVRRRIDELGTTEPTIQRQGDNRIVLEVPGLDDPARLKALLGKTAKLSFRLVDQSMTAQQALATRPPQGTEIIYSNEFDPPQPVLVQKRVMVGGEDLTDAQPGFDQQTNEPIISFQFDTSGARRFGEVTSKNVGRPFAIVLDNEVIAAPVIREPILGGRGQISGSYTVQTANDLAVLLRAGALPAPLNILEERTVGPGLGADSVAAGKIAAMIGFSAVILYIVATYGLFGIFANTALIVNVALIAAALSVLQATLTLPGIAGIVLTIGMAVDANVLVFERIREELRNGKTPINAIELGYNKALTAILDANITTFIAAAILFQLGSGPVRGFSVTLGIGIITSVFTAFVVTRLMVALWFRFRRPKELVL